MYQPQSLYLPSSIHTLPTHLQRRIQLFAHPTLPRALNDAIQRTHRSGERFAHWLMGTMHTMHSTDRQHDNMLPTPFPKIAPYMLMEVCGDNKYQFQPFYVQQPYPHWYKKHNTKHNNSLFVTVLLTIHNHYPNVITKYDANEHRLVLQMNEPKK